MPPGVMPDDLTTPVVRTHRGCHYWFRGDAQQTTHPHRWGGEVRARGAYAVAPPSLHRSRDRYAWVDGCALGDVPLAPLPQEFRNSGNVAKQPRRRASRRRRSRRAAR